MGMGEEAEIAVMSELGRKFSKIGNSKILFPLCEIEVQSCLYGPWFSLVSPTTFVVCKQQSCCKMLILTH